MKLNQTIIQGSMSKIKLVYKSPHMWNYLYGIKCTIWLSYVLNQIKELSVTIASTLTFNKWVDYLQCTYTIASNRGWGGATLQRSSQVFSRF